ncbi:glycoprotein-N-acetylgalactosamine 3-beta-galactosyltransferase 1-like [Oratosquilla oratoria]|uniref:glycoprotein-N-acetylgalactosamine 3-beta-galactosyltransferase 1-like n=1 Tax=Oratosquilla oratoria TaxID=337810 RepID=UPI003F75864C
MCYQIFLLEMCGEGTWVSLVFLSTTHTDQPRDSTVKCDQCPNTESTTVVHPTSYETHRMTESEKSRKLQKMDSGEEENLREKVRVLCWVLTYPKNHRPVAMHVKATWGQRCNKLLFFSSEEDPELPAIKVSQREGRGILWRKTREALKYVYTHHLDDADWFLKADDDTYVVIENLRHMLKDHSPEDPIWMGCRLKTIVPEQGYMSGGAGYVLSRKALVDFVEKAYPYPLECKQRTGGPEDAVLGKCLKNIGVHPADSRDEEGRSRFFPFPPQAHLFSPKRKQGAWFNKASYFLIPQGQTCCSPTSISFHYITPQMMYLLDFLIYNFYVYGRQYTKLPPSLHNQSFVYRNFTV